MWPQGRPSGRCRPPGRRPYHRPERRPFTPFHFGPAILAKAAVPRHLSLAAFVTTQVAIDLETLYHLIRNDWPVHRACHSLAGATLVGIVVATGFLVGGPALLRLLTRGLLAPEASHARSVVAETAPVGVAVGGLLGGWSHSLLDAVMHVDVRPFWPLSDGNPLLGLVGLGWLHIGCVLSGGLGVLWLWGAGTRRTRLSGKEAG